MMTRIQRLWFYGMFHSSEQSIGSYVISLRLNASLRDIKDAVVQVMEEEIEERIFLNELIDKRAITDSRPMIDAAPSGIVIYLNEPTRHNHPSPPWLSVEFTETFDHEVLCESIHAACCKLLAQQQDEDRRRSNLPKLIEAIRDFDRVVDPLEQQMLSIRLPWGFHRFGQDMDRPRGASDLIEIVLKYDSKQLQVLAAITHDSPRRHSLFIEKIPTDQASQIDHYEVPGFIDLTLLEAEHLISFMQSYFRGFSLSITTRSSRESR